MKKVLTPLMAGCFCISIAQTSTDRDKIKKDIEFAQTATKDGLIEIKLGQLAQTHAASSEVKMHAQHMIDDHSKANKELENLATKKSIVLPTSIDNDMQKKYDDLAKLNGKEFDKKYSKLMLEDHKDAIDLFKKESEKGDDSDLKNWAAQKLPTLENHLQMWESACKTIDK